MKKKVFSLINSRDILAGIIIINELRATRHVRYLSRMLAKINVEYFAREIINADADMLYLINKNMNIITYRLSQPINNKILKQIHEALNEMPTSKNKEN